MREGEARTNIHPISLHFDDESMERELRAGTVGSAKSVIMLFGVLNFSLNAMSSLTPLVAAILCVTYALVCAAFRYAPAWLPESEVHNFCSHVWVLSWVGNISAWWVLVNSRTLQRLGPEEGHKAFAACAIWVLVTVVQHVVHIGAYHRAVILAMAMPIIFTSSAWRTELLTSLLVGEATGYALEHMLRCSFLRRAEALDRVRREKERIAFDYAMLRQGHADGGQAAGAAADDIDDAASVSSAGSSR